MSRLPGTHPDGRINSVRCAHCVPVLNDKMRIQSLIMSVLLAVTFSGCTEKKNVEQDIQPSFSGTQESGKFAVIAEAGNGTGMKLTPDVGGEKVYVRFLKAKILEPTEYNQVEFSIRKVKTEDQNWHPVFNSEVGTIYGFSSINLRMEPSHGGTSFEPEDFTDLKELIQPVGAGQPDNPPVKL